MAKTKYVYYFGDGDAEGDESMRPILGGKGARKKCCCADSDCDSSHKRAQDDIKQF